jgi:hydroxymethylpyrimidine pyrophosphatase-like HAD family hydrolase
MTGTKSYRAVFFDWDGTAVQSRTADDSKVIEAMNNLLLKGVDLLIISGTTYGNISGGHLEDRFSREALDHLYLGLARGAVNYGFHNGHLTVLQDNAMTMNQLQQLHEACFHIHQNLLRDYDLKTDIIFSRPNYCKIDLLVDKDRKDQLFFSDADAVFAEKLLKEKGFPSGLKSVLGYAEELLKKEPLPLKTTTDTKYLEVGPTTKSDNIDFLFSLLEQKGIGIEECCFWGDEFGEMADDIMGSDSKMITDRTRSGDFFSVSNLPVLQPKEVQQVGGGCERFVSFLEEQYECA